jgi:peptidoglycan/LPS O-acetylase OafA/YrhL
MIFVTAATLAVTYTFVFRPDQQAIGKQGLAALLSVANIYFWRSTGDYWGTTAEESPFLQTWSLSVEEQFYLFFPIAMWLIFRFRSRWLQGCIATAAVGSLALFLWGLQAHPTATFYLLPTRVWELGAGCLMAVSLSSQPSRKSNFGIFATVGLGMVVLSYLFFDTLSGGLGLAVVGTALIIAFGKTGLCNKLLSQRSVVHIGKLSYSLYLWHWPVLVFAEPLGLDWPGVSDKALLVVAIYVLSLGTYQLVEKPTRRREAVVTPILMSGTMLAGIALCMAFMPRHYDVTGFERGLWIDFDCRPQRAKMVNRIVNAGPLYGVAVRHEGYYLNAHASNGITAGDLKEPPRILVFGDSHGLMWSKAIADAAETLHVSVRFFTIGSGESPFFNLPPTLEGRTRVLSAEEKYQFDIARLRAIQEGSPSLVIIAARWNRSDLAKSSPLLSLLQSLKIPTLLIDDPPLLKIGNRSAMQYLAWKKLLPELSSTLHSTILPCTKPNKYLEESTIAQEIANRYSNVDAIQTYDLFATDQGALVLKGRTPLYVDDDHVTSQGASLLLPRLNRILSEHLSSP